MGRREARSRDTLDQSEPLNMGAQVEEHTLVLPFVRQASRNFIKMERVREVLSLALVSGKFVILYGPGGHGKSEFTAQLLKCVKNAKVFIQSFGEGMDESHLYGGINFRAMNDKDDPRIEYDPKNSFLEADLVVFEEGFDGPATVVRSLKDTLTAKALRKGRQQYRMQTKAIVMLTNHRPSDIAEKGDDYQALVERFALQEIVEWGSYTAEDFVAMFDAIDSGIDCPEITLKEIIELRYKALEVEIPREVLLVYAELIEHARKEGGRISPRTAEHGRDLIKAAAAINGRSVAQEADIRAVKYLPGMEAIASTIEDKIKAASDRAFAQTYLNEAWRIYDEIKRLARSSDSPIVKLKLAALLEQLKDEIAEFIRPPKELVRSRDSLNDNIEKEFRQLGGDTQLYLDLRVELSDQLFGQEVMVPRSGEVTIRERRQLAAGVSYDDDPADMAAQYDSTDEDDEGPTPASRWVSRRGANGDNDESNSSTSATSRFAGLRRGNSNPPQSRPTGFVSRRGQNDDDSPPPTGTGRFGNRGNGR